MGEIGVMYPHGRGAASIGGRADCWGCEWSPETHGLPGWIPQDAREERRYYDVAAQVGVVVLSHPTFPPKSPYSAPLLVPWYMPESEWLDMQAKGGW